MPTDKPFIRGVCSICQQDNIELIYDEEGNTILQEHSLEGTHCVGSYDAPETFYHTNVAKARD